MYLGMEHDFLGKGVVYVTVEGETDEINHSDLRSKSFFKHWDDTFKYGMHFTTLNADTVPYL